VKKGGVEWDEKIYGWYFRGIISWEIMGDAWLIYLGKFHHDLHCSPSPDFWFILGTSSPFMAQQFRLVKYYNLPRYMVKCLERWLFFRCG